METIARARLKWLLDPAVAIAVRLKERRQIIERLADEFFELSRR